MSIHEADLKRLDDWAGARGITRSRAVVALLDLATGETETREQRMARERGLLGPFSKEEVLVVKQQFTDEGKYPFREKIQGQWVDDSEDFKQ